MAEDFLSKIVKEKKVLLKEKKDKVPQKELEEKSRMPRSKRNFKNALMKPGGISLIAEIKQASPSKGIIVEKFNPSELAVIYQKSGADAISVLTEETYFKGNLRDISSVREKTDLPILRKDFIVDTYQVYESYIAGADAILLIAEILSGAQISEFLAISKSLGLDCLVEASSKPELEKILKTESDIIGINNRDLRSFKVDLETSRKLIPLIPKGKIVVAESGIKDAKDVKTIKDLGANAVLIGEALLKAGDIPSKIKQLIE